MWTLCLSLCKLKRRTLAAESSHAAVWWQWCDLLLLSWHYFFHLLQRRCTCCDPHHHPSQLYSMSVVFNADRLTEGIQWAICENAVRGMMRNSCVKVLIATYDSVSQMHFYFFLEIRSYALLCYCSAEMSIFDPTLIGFSAMFSKLKRISHLIVRTKWVRSESILSVVLMQFDACVFERWCILKLILC